MPEFYYSIQLKIIKSNALTFIYFFEKKTYGCKPRFKKNTYKDKENKMKEKALDCVSQQAYTNFELITQNLNPFMKDLNIKLKSKNGIRFSTETYKNSAGEDIEAITQEQTYIDNAFFVKMFDEVIFEMIDLDRCALNLLLWIINQLNIQLNSYRTSSQPSIQTLLLMTYKLCDKIEVNGKTKPISMSEKSFYLAKNELIKRGIIKPKISHKNEGYIWINPSFFFAGKREAFAKTVSNEVYKLCDSVSDDLELIEKIKSEFLPKVITPSKKETTKKVIKDQGESCVSIKTEYIPPKNIIEKETEFAPPAVLTNPSFDENDIGLAFSEDFAFSGIETFKNIETEELMKNKFNSQNSRFF